MRISKNVLNNMMMDNQRRNPLYQTIITDLAIVGAIDRDDAEMLLGYKIPSFLKTPDGQSLEDEKPVEKKEEKKSAVKTESKKPEKEADEDKE